MGDIFTDGSVRVYMSLLVFLGGLFQAVDVAIMAPFARSNGLLILRSVLD